jgi:hypothetical protein
MGRFLHLGGKIHMSKMCAAVSLCRAVRSGRLVYLLAVTLFALGVGDYAWAQTPVLTKGQREDVAYVLAKIPNGGTVTFDMSDPVQYRFYLNQLKLAGLTPQRSPQLFRRLDVARRRSQSSPPRGPVLKDGAAGGPTAANIITDLKTNDQLTFVANALSSIPGGSYATVLTLGLYDVNNNPIGATQQTTQFNQGQNVKISAQGQFQSRAATNGQLAQALGTYFYEDKDGNAYQGAFAVRSAFYPQNITNLAPKVINNPNLISICLDRMGSLSGCDYACPQGLNCTRTTQPPNQVPNVIFPINGSITYFDDIDPIQYDQQGNPTNAFSLVTVVFTQSGGNCLQSLTTNFFKDPNTVVNGKTLSWNFNPAQFGTACYPATSPTTYSFSVYVSVKGSPVWAFINNTGTTPAQSTLIIPATQMVIGCLAEGTTILMEDGSERRVERFDARERIISDSKGTALTVANTLFGNEHNPMFMIKTDKGQTLLLTDAHPVITKRGVVLARRLKTGDIVRTTKGDAKITSVTTERFNGKVWNLDVGAPEDKVKFTPENTTFYANGILVGDSKMQGYWDLVDRRDPRSVIQSIPKRWHRDYLNYIAGEKKKIDRTANTRNSK